MMYDWHGWGWGMGFGWVLMGLFWILVVLAIVALARWLLYGQGSGGSNRQPLDILKERYARGEISKEQYEQMRRDIES